MPDPNASHESPRTAPAERLGEFRIVREIGRGGMGVVYEAEDVNLGRRVALKLLTQRMLRDANQRRRFEREAKSAAKLHHTNIVPVFGFGEADGTPYYAMQFIEGAGLDAVVAEVARLSAAPPPSAPPSREHGAAAAARSLVTGGAFDGDEVEPAPADEFAATGTFALAAGAEPPVPETGTHVPGGAAPRAVPTADTSAVLSGMTSSATMPGHTASGIGRKLRKLTYWQGVARIGAQVADALDYAHRQGIVHRDVKPSNLLLDAAGTVWVTDFGLAKADGGDNLTHTGDVLGTLRYMPPEAFEGKADERSDIYALGLTLYELLALRPAFDESDRNKLIKLVTQAEPARLRKVRPDVPRDLDTIVHKAIDRDPARRYQKAADLAADLQRFLDDEPIKARRQTAAEAAWRWARRHKLEAALGALVAVVLVAATVASVVLAAHFRHQEYVQRRTADERAALAEHNRNLADDNEAARKTAEGALERSRQSQRDLNLTLADMYTLQGLQAGPTGRHREAPLWFAKAAEVGASDPHRAWANRIRAQAWSAELSRPVAAYRHPSCLSQWSDKQTIRLTFHPIGRYLLVDGFPGDQILPVVFDVETNRTLPLPGGAYVRAAAWTPDGTRIAVAAQTGVTLYRFPELADPEPCTTGITAGLLRFSSDGQLLALCDAATARVWDRGTRALVGAAWQHTSGVRTAEFTTDGARLVTSDRSNAFRVFRLGAREPELTGKHVFAQNGWTSTGPLVTAGNRLLCASASQELVVHTLDGTQPPAAVQLPFAATALWRSADGARAVAHSETASVVFDPSTGERVCATESGGLCADFHPDGKSFVSGGGNPLFNHHTLPSGERGPALAAEATGFRAMSFARDGRFLATAGYEGQIRVWALPPRDSGFAVPATRTSPGRASFSADSQSVLVTVAPGSARLYDVATGQPKGPPLKPGAGSLLHAALAPSGGLAVLVVARPEGTRGIEFRDPRTGTERFAHEKLPSEPVLNGMHHPVALSPTGNRAAVLCTNGLLSLFDLTTGARVCDVQTGIREGSRWALFSADGRTLLVRGDTTVQIREPGDGSLRFPAHAHPDHPHVAVSADGTRFATAGKFNVLRVWDCATGAQLGPDVRHPSWIDAGVAFHPDGGHVATGGKDGAVRVWEVATGTKVAEVASAGGASAFTPDGRALVTVCRAGTVDVWDWKTGTRLLPRRTLSVLNDPSYTGVRNLEISPDGRFAAVGGRPHLHVLCLTALTPAHAWAERDLLDWGELLSHQEFRGSGPANLSGPEWLARWQAFRARHPERLPGDSAPARPEAVAARLVEAGRWADAERVVAELLARTATDPAAVEGATDLFRKATRARQAGAVVPALDTAAVRAACEKALAANPDRADLAALLAAILLEAHEPVVWHTLRPTAARSESGATLTIENDGSVLASGLNPDRDTYTLETGTILCGIAALRLEALPDPSLPQNGPGRVVSGNFCLTEVGLHLVPPGGVPRSVRFTRAAGYQRPFGGDTTLRDGPHGAIDGTHATRWDAYPQYGQAHRVTLETVGTGVGRAIVRLDFQDPMYVRHTLGRFRMSVTDRPNVARDENLIALAVKGNGWVQLGVARIVRGEWKDAVGPLQKATADPGAAFDAHLLLALTHEHLGHPVLADLNFNAALKFTRTIDPLILEVGFEVIGRRISREPANAELLLRRFRWHATMGHTTAAVTDLIRARELEPTRTLEPGEATALSQLAYDAAARGDWAAARTALESGPQPADLFTLSRLALVRARLGDAAGHRRACEELLERFGSAPAPYTAFVIARAWGARPIAAVPARAGEVAALASTPAAFALGYQVRALSEYRAGRFAAAVEWCDKCEAAKPSADLRACADAVRAMALFRLGRTDEARAALRESAPRRVPPNARAVYAAYEWLVADLLRIEAEALLAVPVAPPPRG